MVPRNLPERTGGDRRRPPGDFVSSTGEVRVSAFAERSRDFLLRSDLISITVGY